MKNKANKLYRPRVLVSFNTGTRVILSKRDRAMNRRSLKKDLKKMVDSL